MEQILQVTKDSALQAYKAADINGKGLIANLFGAKHFFVDIKEWEAYIIPRVKSFEDACRELGLDPRDAKYWEGEPDEQSYKQQKVVVKALNGPFLLDMKNTNQKKWRVWYEITPAGFRLYAVYFDYSAASTGLGSRLLLCSESLARHFANQFLELQMPFIG